MPTQVLIISNITHRTIPMKAKTEILINGDDSISFTIYRKKHMAEITYYYAYGGGSEETVTCSVHDADERYESAIKSGYKVAY